MAFKRIGVILAGILVTRSSLLRMGVMMEATVEVARRVVSAPAKQEE